jgi:hypothetical protein
MCIYYKNILKHQIIPNFSYSSSKKYQRENSSNSSERSHWFYQSGICSEKGRMVRTAELCLEGGWVC